MANGTQYFLNEEGQYEPMQTIPRGARNRSLARRNLIQQIKSEQEQLEEASSKLGLNQAIGGFLGGSVLDKVVPGLGTYLGSQVGNLLTSKENKDVLAGEGIRFLDDEAEDLSRTLQENMYSNVIKNAISAGALDMFDKTGLGDKWKDLFGGKIDKDFADVDYIAGAEDVTGDDAINILDIVAGISDGAPQLESAAIPTAPGTTSLGDMLASQGPLKSPQITDAPRLFKNVVLEDGTRARVPAGMRSADRVSFIDQLTSIPGKIREGFEDLEMPKLQRLKPQVEVPARESFNLRDMLPKMARRVVDPATGGRYTLPMGGELVQNIISGNFSESDLIEFQEMVGLQGTGILDEETSRILSYLEGR